MLIYDIKEYSNNYSKTSDCLWQYYTDKPAPAIENSESYNASSLLLLSSFGELLKCL